MQLLISQGDAALVRTRIRAGLIIILQKTDPKENLISPRVMFALLDSQGLVKGCGKSLSGKQIVFFVVMVCLRILLFGVLVLVVFPGP
ncbi:hypothetical protein HUK65_18400 [Rhodobacteraceae bacterium 2376]|uniref:Uncharacterized protein n=1 Tax=Rhabdonatronobacter sediminivivens TaxID=2743469 RepID=A0A7Z0I2U6_9RHOB|nr:hypothetical protein [Rhabdonatronobacter sediminivivens]NYS26925.1 hypothetical protein [Rhabdonatronobacter sediminivivens]